MRTSLVVPEPLWEALAAHVLSGDKERFGFLLCERNRTPGLDQLLAVDVELLSDDDVAVVGYECELNTDALLRVTNRAAQERRSLVEAHGHLLGLGDVNFSQTDLRGQEEIAAYVDGVLPDPYGALVLAPDWQWAGQFWNNRRASRLEALMIHGNDGMSWHYGSQPARQPILGDRDSRQVLAFGEEGIRLLRCARVSVVGAGGLGSHICQQLAYLGVRQLDVIDFDCVDGTNLNRLVGAGQDDVGRLKVDVIEREVRRIDASIKVNAVPKNLRHLDSLCVLREADVLIGAVDGDGARLLLNELAIAYSKPYIDCGTGISSEGGQIKEAGGQVVVYLPGRPCLLCAGLVDLNQARFELSSQDEQAQSRARGYVSGEDIEAPAVVFINGTVASLAVGEFAALITRARATTPYTLYDYVAATVVKWPIDAMLGCPACAWAGIGDKVQIERYIEQTGGN